MLKDQGWTLRDRMRILMIHQLFPRANVTQKWELYESSSAQYGDISRTKDAFAKHSQRVKEQLTAFDLNMFNEDGEDVSTPEITNTVDPDCLSLQSSHQTLPKAESEPQIEAGFPNHVCPTWGSAPDTSGLMYHPLPAPIAQMTTPMDINHVLNVSQDQYGWTGTGGGFAGVTQMPSYINLPELETDPGYYFLSATNGWETQGYQWPAQSQSVV